MGKVNNCCVHICYMVWAVVITERSGRDLSDYQVRVEINDPQFFQECTEQRFVEFYDSDKTTMLPHYTELFDVANKRAVFWVKVPSIPASGTKTIYLNVNTERTEDLSDPEAVFDFFDDFEGDSLDTSKWTANYVNSVDYEVVNSNLRIKDATKSSSTYWIYNNTDTGSQIKANFSVLDRMIIEWKQKMETQSSASQLGEVGIGLCKENKTVEAYLSELDGSGSAIVYEMGGDVINGQSHTQFVDINADTYYILRVVKDGDNYKLEAIDEQGNVVYPAVTGSSTAVVSYMAICVGAYGGHPFSIMQIDWVRVRKYTEPEPSVMVVKGGATATLDFKRIVAKALAGKISHILNGDPRIRLYSGGSLIKEITAGARLRKEDTANKRFIVMFLFVDDSNDAYTTDSQELVFPHDDGDYVAFTQSESFEKVSNEPLPLRWEIYVPWAVDDFGWG